MASTATDELELAGYCARPMCRNQFQQATGRGRPRDYCSDTCRRLADRDYKRARAIVAHFESLAERSRHDVAAFGRAQEELEATHPQAMPIDVNPALAAALARADAVLEFFPDRDDRLLGELRALRDAASGR